jgi:hypothetical protein
MCASHNQRIEGDLIREGLANGWKIKSFRGGFQAFDLPYYDRTDHAWYRPLDLDRADPLVPLFAIGLLEMAGSFQAADENFRRDFPHLFTDEP